MHVICASSEALQSCQEVKIAVVMYALSLIPVQDGTKLDEKLCPPVTQLGGRPTVSAK